MLDISVTNFTRRRIPKTDVIKCARQVLKTLGRKQAELSIVIVGARRMANLNTRYRHKAGTTDVLSFRLSEAQSKLLRGEIVLCYEEVVAGSRREQVKTSNYLKYLLIHGILHLVGYEHENVSAQVSARMEKRQQQLTRKFNVDF
jgi:probable rRNA maturation factor